MLHRASAVRTAEAMLYSGRLWEYKEAGFASLPRSHSCSTYMILKLAKNQDEYLLRCDMASKLTLSLAAQLVLHRHDH